MPRISLRISWLLRYFLSRTNVCSNFLASLSPKLLLDVSSLRWSHLIEQEEGRNVVNRGKHDSVRETSSHISGEATRIYEPWREKRGRQFGFWRYVLTIKRSMFTLTSAVCVLEFSFIVYLNLVTDKKTK